MASSSEFDSSDSESDAIPLNIVRRIIHRNRRNAKLADKLNNGSVANTDLFDDTSSEDDFDDDSEPDVSDDDGPNTVDRDTGDEPMPSDVAEDTDSDDQRPLLQPRGRPRSRGRPPGRRARPRTPPRQWTDHLTNEIPKRFTGSQPGPRDDHSDESELETFGFIFTEEFVRTIVTLTNLNYHKKSQKSPNKHKMKWDDVTQHEMHAWFGVIIGMGLTQLKGDIRKYWSARHKLTRTQGFSEVFPRDRFLQILRYIHFVDESTAVTNHELAGYDKFYKIRYIFTYLVPKFQAVYLPCQFLAVDESMIKGQSRMPARQFMKNKPVRWGLKVFALAESSTGYILNAELYEGKNGGEAQTPGKVVQKLVQPYRGRGHIIFTDNFYTSVDLYSKLYLDGCMAVGTLRENRKELPRDSVGKKKELVKKLKRGESLYRQSDNMYCVTWKDTKNVYMLSTVPTTNASEQVNRMVKKDGKWTKISIDRPNIVGLYNKYMGGVDLADKKIVCYKRQTKSLKWYHKVMWYMVDIAILNAYIVYTSVPKNKNVKLRDFREALCTSLIGGRNYRKGGHVAILDDHQRFNRNLNHAPIKMATSSTCKVHAERVDTIYTCAVCNIRMCPDPCFARFHYMDKFVYHDPKRNGKDKARKKLKLTGK